MKKRFFPAKPFRDFFRGEEGIIWYKTAPVPYMFSFFLPFHLETGRFQVDYRLGLHGIYLEKDYSQQGHKSFLLKTGEPNERMIFLF